MQKKSCIGNRIGNFSGFEPLEVKPSLQFHVFNASTIWEIPSFNILEVSVTFSNYTHDLNVSQ